MAHISDQTRSSIKYDIVRHFAEEDEALHGLPIPLSTTATSAGTTTLDDSKLGRGTTDANRYDGRFIEITEIVTSSPTINSVAVVNNAGFDGTDTLTLSPAFGATPQSGTDYTLYPRNLSPDTVFEAIDKILRTTEAPHLFIPTLVVNGDLDASTAANWTDVGSPSTSTEVVTTAANVFLGERSLHFVADAAGEGMTSDAIAVTEGEQLTLSVFVYANVGSVQVVLRRNTATAVDIKAVTINERAWTEVRFTETVPAGCEEVSVRFLSTAASDDVYISAFVTLQTQNERPYDLPSWFTNERMFEGAHYIPQGWASESANSYIALSRANGNVGIEPEFIRSDRAVHPMKVQLRSHINRPIAFDVRRNFPAFPTDTTADATGTHADREYVVNRAIHNIMEARGERDIIYGRRAARIAKTLDYGKHSPRMREDRLVLATWPGSRGHDRHRHLGHHHY